MYNTVHHINTIIINRSQRQLQQGYKSKTKSKTHQSTTPPQTKHNRNQSLNQSVTNLDNIQTKLIAKNFYRPTQTSEQTQLKIRQNTSLQANSQINYHKSTSRKVKHPRQTINKHHTTTQIPDHSSATNHPNKRKPNNQAQIYITKAIPYLPNLPTREETSHQQDY